MRPPPVELTCRALIWLTLLKPPIEAAACLEIGANSAWIVSVICPEYSRPMLESHAGCGTAETCSQSWWRRMWTGPLAASCSVVAAPASLPKRAVAREHLVPSPPAQSWIPVGFCLLGRPLVEELAVAGVVVLGQCCVCRSVFVRTLRGKQRVEGKV